MNRGCGRKAGVLLVILAGPALADGAQPYGCWAIRDDLERLACFDLALGPPAPEARDDRSAAPRDPARPPAAEPPGAATHD